MKRAISEESAWYCHAFEKIPKVVTGTGATAVQERLTSMAEENAMGARQGGMIYDSSLDERSLKG